MGVPVMMVCCRVGDPYYVPRQGARKLPCSQCQHPCHVDSWEFQQITGIPVWCIVCWHRRRQPQDLIIELPSCSKEFSPTDN